jgi:signal transduction histidine kinase
MKSFNKSLSEIEVYRFAVFTIFWFVVSLFFSSVSGILEQDITFYINASGAALCLLLLLQDVWISFKEQAKFQLYLWYFILCLCLPLLTSVTFFSSGYSFIWFLNLVLTNTLLYLLVKNIFDFLVILIIGVSLGFAIEAFSKFYLLRSLSLQDDLALYFCFFFIARIALVMHDRVYVQKRVYSLVEKEIRDRTKDLHNALEVKTEFLDNVSHEIKTPVHTITNVISLLLDQWKEISEEEKLELLVMLKNDNARLLSFCSNLLDLSKFLKGHGIKTKKCHILDILKEVMTEYKSFEHLISINIPMEVKINNFIVCDPQKILQVMRNLLDNAIKYGKKSDIEIGVRDNTAEYITFSVSDKGIGVPEKELKDVFNPFEQSSRTKTRAGGTGLGLTICKKIIEYHNGQIWAKNNEEGGSTFFFTLPKYRKT